MIVETIVASITARIVDARTTAKMGAYGFSSFSVLDSKYTPSDIIQIENM